jgi:hypothetical protein
VARVSLFATSAAVLAPTRRPATSTTAATTTAWDRIPSLRASRSGLLALLTIIGCVAVYVITGPPHDGDLAAQVARADVFGKVGFVPWFASWYAGLHTGGYSLITPELMWWLKPAGLGVVCLVLTEAFGYALLRAGGAKRAAAGATALTVFQLGDLLAGRVTFAAGAVVLLAALLAAERERPLLVIGLAMLASFTSPVDGLVAILLAGAYLWRPPVRWLSPTASPGVDAPTAAHRRREGVTLGLGAGAGLLAVITLFPDPGYEPFSLATMVPALLTSVAIAFLPVSGLVRRAALLSGALIIGCFFIHSPVGVNVTRVPLLMGAPAVIASLRGRLAVTLPVIGALLVWPAIQLHHDTADAKDPAAKASFYTPLTTELKREPAALNHRVEVVEPRTHWQVVYLEPTVTLARGWERQLDTSLNPALYSDRLNASSYRAFLDRNAVSLVAVPHGTPLDFGSYSENRLINAGLPYLRAIWSNPSWTLYAVSQPTAIATGAGASVDALTTTGVRLTTTGAGVVKLRMRYSPYLTVSGGSVLRQPSGDAELRLRRGGPHDVHAVWSFGGAARAITDHFALAG